MALFGGNTLYYPGCVSKFFLKEIVVNYEKLLNQIGVNFIKLEELKCCGIEALESGYRKPFYNVMDENEQVFETNKINKIISNCPKCVRTFKDFYGMNAEHILNSLLKNVIKLPEKNGDITYYDGPELGRKLSLTEEPRAILRAVGYNVIELKDNREKVFCCGAGGGLKRNSPRVANKIAEILLSKVKTEILVTADAECYKHLKENANGIKVYELSEVLL